MSLCGLAPVASSSPCNATLPSSSSNSSCSAVDLQLHFAPAHGVWCQPQGWWLSAHSECQLACAAVAKDCAGLPTLMCDVSMSGCAGYRIGLVVSGEPCGAPAALHVLRTFIAQRVAV